MNALEQANAAVTVVGGIPTVAAYYQAKHYFHFKHRSAKQLLAVFLALLVILGTIFLQSSILQAWGLPERNEYLRKLIAIQYAVAVLVFFWRLKMSSRSLRVSATDAGADAK